MSLVNSPKDPAREFHYEELDSTQDEAARLLLRGYKPPFFVHTDNQTRGRGRLNREWVSERGSSLTLTLCCRSSSSFIAGLSLVVGLSVIRSFQRTDLRLKWPNDIMIGDAKVGGILVESKSQGPTVDYLIGVGLNLREMAKAQYQGLNEKMDAGPLVAAIQSDLEVFFRDGFRVFLSAYEEKMWRLSQMVTYNIHGEFKAVKVLGVTDDGALKTESQGVLVTRVDGEIVHEE